MDLYLNITMLSFWSVFLSFQFEIFLYVSYGLLFDPYFASKCFLLSFQMSCVVPRQDTAVCCWLSVLFTRKHDHMIFCMGILSLWQSCILFLLHYLKAYSLKITSYDGVYWAIQKQNVWQSHAQRGSANGAIHSTESESTSR